MLSTIRAAVATTSVRRHQDVASYSIAWDQLRDHYRCQSTNQSDKISSDPPGARPPKRKGEGRPTIDRSKVPVINEKDLDEMFISGHGPGGQSVNKSVNCCQIRHKPTGIVIKVHETRSLEKNRQIAREILITRLDNLYNGEASVESQKRRQALQNIATRESQSGKRRTLKEQYKRILNESKSNDQ